MPSGIWCSIQKGSPSFSIRDCSTVFKRGKVNLQIERTWNSKAHTSSNLRYCAQNWQKNSIKCKEEVMRERLSRYKNILFLKRFWLQCRNWIYFGGCSNFWSTLCSFQSGFASLQSCFLAISFYFNQSKDDIQLTEVNVFLHLFCYISLCDWSK